MKIVIDLRIFGLESGGLGRYNQKLFENLIVLDDRNNQYILLFKEKPDDLPPLPDNFKIKVCNCHWYTLKEQIILPFVLSKLKPDLVHFTHFNVPLFYKGKFIVTIHDLIMSRFPSRGASTLNRVLFFLKYRLYNQIIKHAVKKSIKIIAVSKFTAQDIKDYFKLSEQEAKKIKVIYEGVTIPQATETKIDLLERFFLYIGNAYPHKNLKFLIKAFQEFLKKHPDFYLILVGNKDYFYQRLIKKISNKNIIFTGFVPDNQLSNYYQQATAYIFPSLYEGFGLPPLEAMAYNLPVLSSKAASLPEVLGQAALYFDPGDERDLLNKMELIVDDQNLRDKLKSAGQEQIKKYSWQKMAQKIIEFYRK
ncbi:MAG: hypothetical protein COV55_04335 [Candidatus Komeilibacteria bacterium CG11_big_fil_rev_8_21_14_0_20_36_20]|uniref:Glycosyl transferase family 1 n=2 Tax=Patescibacteria group TaxID=1783273 RepID=A0A2H0NBQ4_9BACT|nr:MAG: hypothetical protein COV55_04335 [Candidatus Komeilibacteria bacterium CG11_big_fil_rev_8_21_14_0_20_36_20]PIR81471.1 MAG: hypothetical protein COU21_03565 [Candidatus Komeilibacteria bacterium CG10_big_fil_rev_8_21_14_0_10_36_65]PIZ65666.1 MAG: hypothetical protein COY14_01845 [Candidatus Roizmanbacteria bacterium CG_4_10_14_0_2_um_filter_36_9]PJC55672.1 MAG: hypothetical protein CO027_00920 [Candidatus Komeilibacteria bacterium CG_4_9_14_0_2_um_filter_36_13]